MNIDEGESFRDKVATIDESGNVTGCLHTNRQENSIKRVHGYQYFICLFFLVCPSFNTRANHF